MRELIEVVRVALSNRLCAGTRGRLYGGMVSSNFKTAQHFDGASVAVRDPVEGPVSTVDKETWGWVGSRGAGPKDCEAVFGWGELHIEEGRES